MTGKRSRSGPTRLGMEIGAALLALMYVMSCGSDGGEASAGDTSADDVGIITGTGPASACGGVASGEWVSGGGSAGSGQDKFVLSVGPAESRVDILARARAGGSGADAYLLIFLGRSAESAELKLSADARELSLSNPELDPKASIAGDVFDDLNDGFGGLLLEGRLCLDAAPVTGQPLAGSWYFLFVKGEEQKLHRIQGSFSVAGDAVTAGTGTLEILTADAASLIVD